MSYIEVKLMLAGGRTSEERGITRKETTDRTDLAGGRTSEDRGIAHPLSSISAKSGRRLPTGGRWPAMTASPRETRASFGLVKIIILTRLILT